MTTLMISNEEMDDILNITKSLKESGLLIKGVSGTIEKNAFLDMPLDTLGYSLLRNLLAAKGVKAKISGRGVIWADEGTIRADEGTFRAVTIGAGQDF